MSPAVLKIIVDSCSTLSSGCTSAAALLSVCLGNSQEEEHKFVAEEHARKILKAKTNYYYMPWSKASIASGYSIMELLIGFVSPVFHRETPSIDVCSSVNFKQINAGKKPKQCALLHCSWIHMNPS